MRPIPTSIKSQIIRMFLEGDSTTEISKQLKVSVGTVSTITTEESKNDEYYLYMRELAKKFKNMEIEIPDVISGIRLYHKIKEVGLTCSFFENFLDSTNVSSFRLGMDHDKFLEKIKTVLSLEEQYKIQLADMPEFIKNKYQEIKVVKDKIREVTEQKYRLYFKYFVKKEEIEDYIKERPSFLLYKSEKETAASGTYFDWIIPDEIFEKAFRKKRIKIDRKILYGKLNSIFRDPGNHIEIIEKIINYFENHKR
jgi:hypothetical protein